MTAYTKSTNFATKDTLTSGDPLKIVKGTEINTEFDNIATSVNSKSDTASPTFTGTVTIPILSYAGTTLSAAVTGTGKMVLDTSPTLSTPALGTPSALVGTNITGTAAGLTAGNVTTNANLTGAIISVGNAASLGSFTSSQLLTALTDETGTGSAVFATSPTLVTPALGTPASGVLTNCTGVQYNGFKNRIINGAMVIDQRNAGASVATSSGSQIFAVDRWQAVYSQVSKFTLQQNAASVTPPTGFINYFGITSSSAYTVGSGEQFNIRQAIEGLNVTDLGWGTASAATVTLSFWVRSSLTGTFGGCLMNSATNRSYPFSFTISAANTWEQKSVTVAGDITGTWLTTNGVGVYVWFGLGVGSTLSATAGAWAAGYYPSATGATSVVGTNGATFYITGVQLEKGSTATTFDYRPYGTELQLCQRYYESSAFPATSFSLTTMVTGVITGSVGTATGRSFAVAKRAAPTVVLYSRNNTANAVSLTATGADVVGTSTASSPTITGFASISLGAIGAAAAGLESGYTASAEL